jgi:hypothetical protein
MGINQGRCELKVLTAASVNVTSFWDIAPCSLIEVDRRFRDAYCRITLMMEALSTSETSARLRYYTAHCTRRQEMTKSMAPESEGSSPCSQEPATGSYSESAESTPHVPARLPKIHSDPILLQNFLTTCVTINLWRKILLDDVGLLPNSSGGTQRRVSTKSAHHIGGGGDKEGRRSGFSVTSGCLSHHGLSLYLAAWCSHSIVGLYSGDIRL